MRDNKFDPTTELFIAGIDLVNGKLDGPDHPCFNEESNKTPDDTPEMRSMIKRMVARPPFTAVTVTTIGTTRYVDAGRRRVRALRIANAQRVAAGLEPHKIATVSQLFSGDERDAELVAIATMENYARHANRSPLAPVRDATRLHNLGKGPEEIAVLMAVTASNVRRWLKIATLSPTVQAAIEAGKITEEAALLLHGKPVEEQDAVLAQLVESKTAEVFREIEARQTRKPPAPAEERKAQLVAKKRTSGKVGANGGGRKQRAPAASRSRVSRVDAAIALGKSAKRSTKTLLKLLEMPACALSPRDRLVVRWTQGLATDAEVGLFAAAPPTGAASPPSALAGLDYDVDRDVL